MSIRKAVELKVAKETGTIIDDQLFRIAANQADNDIWANHIKMEKLTSFDYVVWVVSQIAVLLINIDKKSTCLGA